MAGSVFADAFINGGFEAGTTNGWIQNSGTWSTSKVTTDNKYQGDSAIIATPNATDANTLGHLYEVRQGNDSFRLNNAANGAHFSTLTQTVAGYTNADMYFGFAAVLENPDSGHTAAETPKFSFSIYDNTAHSNLYAVAFNSINAAAMGVTWNTGLRNNGNSSTWMYTDWNVIHVDTSVLSGLNNHSFTISVGAYDCALGGHGGYAYVDSFQADLPIANHGGFNLIQANNLIVASVPEPTSVGLWLLGGVALWGYRNASGPSARLRKRKLATNRRD